VAVDGLLLVSSLAVSTALLLRYLPRAGEGGGALLFTYWTLTLPLLGQEVASVLRQLPTQRNLALRLLEPLGALEEGDACGAAAPPFGTAAAAVRFEGVAIRASGHTLLSGVDLELPAGSHVAIVGPSGAGKSTLLGALLGWHRPAEGALLVDGAPLVGAALEALRQRTVWLDPAVHLWNRSLLDNLRYGAAAEVPVGQVLAEADLHRVLLGLPDGLGTSLGEGGGLVSGGEGQRVRFGRSLARPVASLVLLDEPFRGLDRARRRGLLAQARKTWEQATLLCVTHDVGETLRFSRVLVVEGGRVVEDGAPEDLLGRPGSRYACLLEEEQALHRELFGGGWRRLWLEDGGVREDRGAREEGVG
jgi:ATP-binding cassette subfamily B protein